MERCHVSGTVPLPKTVPWLSHILCVLPLQTLDNHWLFYCLPAVCSVWCVWRHSCVCVLVGAHECKGQRSTLGVFLSCSPHFFLKDREFSELGAFPSLRPAGQWAAGPTYLPYSAGITNASHHAECFQWHWTQAHVTSPNWATCLDLCPLVLSFLEILKQEYIISWQADIFLSV